VDALDDFRSNIAQIRAQGGYPVVNHPLGGAGWNWNSYDEALGIESNALHGVEIWNTEVDGSQSGQGGNVGRWVDWLLDGRILYAYAGSDTHDEANAIGANYAVITGGTFDRESLESSLRGGRVYISNGPALSIEVDAYGQTLFMGTRHAVPYGDPSPTITVRTAYHFGSADTGSISFYSGRVGDPWGEIRIIHQTGLTGSGTISTQASLTTDYVSWYRAYLEVGGGAKAAYTNPVFFVPSYGNDHCANATPLYGDGVFAVDNTAGTGLDADPGCASMGSDVWYEWTAAATGTVTMDMCDGTTNYDSALAAWEGPSGCPTSLITCNDDVCGLRSQVTFACTIGAVYMIQVGGWNGETGTGTLTVNTDGGSCTDTIYCTSLPNSTGTTASLSWSGSCAVADNNFTLNMAGGPASQPGLFIYSASQASNPFGNGILCLSGTINRLNPPIFMDGAGTMSKFVDLANPPSSSAAITAGSTWHFQAWYRDATGGGAGYNLSDGLEITFAPGPYEGMVLVPGGTFEMGRHVGSGDQDETPLHTVSLDAFYMDGNQVSIEKYVTYLNNALARGEVTVTNNVVYQVGGAAQPLCDTFWSSGCSHLDWDGSAFSTISGWEEQPINLVSWYGACAYANGRSRDNGLTPCYDESDWSCDFTADGYRLPTEAEWEYAARGGEHNPYYMYPWGDSIDGSKANYLGSGDPYESDSPATTPVGYYDGSQTPAGVDMANGHGLYDAVGNVREWCWDWYDSSYYSNSPSNNPTGPTSGSLRVGRGGGSNYATPFLRSAYRDARPPTQRYCTNGLGRVVAAFP
jgi:formylglycine-generating enzyme required for sulfatase activity